MFKVHIHAEQFSTHGSFVATSEDHRLNSSPIPTRGSSKKDPEDETFFVRWDPLLAPAKRVTLTREVASSYAYWLASVRKLVRDCENGKFVFTTDEWRIDLAGIDPKNYEIVKPDVKLHTRYHSFVVYKNGVAITRLLRSDEEAEAFFALFNSYLSRMAEINNGHFHLF